MAEGSLQVNSETWSGGDTVIAKAVARPLARFLAQETASGVLLLIATVVALVWVNTPGIGDFYDTVWDTHLAINLGDTDLLDLSLHGWVNDALMALFFFVVGMEIKGELVAGELNNPRVAALPAIGALGGMVLPAALYLAINFGSETTHGWGVPMATDIAFAVGVLALMGPRVPSPLKLFLLTLAIVDDIGAIVVIAVFYNDSLSAAWLGVAVGLLVLVVVLQRLRVWYIPVYALIGVVVWFATHESGVHATIAGVALGLLTPAKPLRGERLFENLEDIFSGDRAEPREPVLDPFTLREANFELRESVSVTQRLTSLLSPWTSFIVIPIFALANAGVLLTGDAVSGAVGSVVTWGVIAGLVIGKPVGIGLFAYAAVKTGVARLPDGVRTIHLFGVGAVAGIGFTVALFIASLAFTDPAVSEQAVMGILGASILAAALGWLLLRIAQRGDEPLGVIAGSGPDSQATGRDGATSTPDGSGDHGGGDDGADGGGSGDQGDKESVTVI